MPKPQNSEETPSTVEQENETLRQTIDTLEQDKTLLQEQVDQLQADLADAHQQLIAARKSPVPGGVTGTAPDVHYQQYTVLKPFGYRRRDGAGKVLERRLAKPGQIVDLTQEQADKLQPNGVVGTDQDLADLNAQKAQGPEPVRTDLLEQSAVIAHLNQHQDDDELDRVELLEEDRADGPREDVLDAINTIRATKDA